MSWIRGSACSTARMVSGAMADTLAANSSALAIAAPSGTRYCTSPALSAAAASLTRPGGIMSPIPGAPRRPPAHDAAGEHHVRHPRSAEQPRDIHGGTAAYVDATHAFRQREECRLVRDADVAGRCQLEPAPDGRSVQRGDHGDATTAKQRERRVPCAGKVKSFYRFPRAVLREVEAG